MDKLDKRPKRRKHKDNPYILESIEQINEINDDFSRYDVTINYPNEAISDLTIKIYLDEIGTVYIDDVQLEEGEVANTYNLVENSDFSDGLDDWTLKLNALESKDEILQTGVFEIITLPSGSNALKVKMNPKNNSEIFKEFSINGKEGDTYRISFWYKDEGYVGETGYGSSIINDASIFFNYTDTSTGFCVFPSKAFTPNESEWQYFSGDFVAFKDYDKMTLSFSQSFNANNFYITNICLFKNPTSVQYSYDQSGNISDISNLNNQLSHYNYDKNNQLIKMTDPKGKNFTFEYDNVVTDRVINGISDMGISNIIKYDSLGNPITTKIIKNNVSGYIVDGLYKIRLKGTEIYLRNINNEVKFLEDDCGHDLWKIEKNEECYQIKHSIIENKYLTITNSTVVLNNFNNDNSLFTFIKNNNGSYSIKIKATDTYLKENNSLFELSTLLDDDYHFEFYFEPVDNELFIENNAEYTSDGRFIKSTTDTLLNKTLYDIDSITGLTKSITNSKNQTTYYNYNDKKQLVSISSGNKSVTYNYNNQNMLYKITQGNKEYKFDYDEFFNTKSIKIGDAITLVTNNYENNNGNLISSTYGNNQTINYEYDNFNRIKKLIKINDIYNYKYGNNGDLVKIISNDDTIKYTYDLATRLSEYRFNDFKINYQYDINNNIINTKYNYNNKNYNINNVFNDDDLIIKTILDDKEINYNYDSLGRLINSNINNNFNTDYKYITNGKKTSLLVKSVGNNNDIYSYKYDKLNNITHIYHNNKLENRYYYDEYNELIKENNYITNQTIKYTYDNSGNILSKKIYDLNNYNFISENKYEYNNTNWEDQLTKFNNEIITYDEIGNPLTIGNNITLNWINGRQLNTYTDSNNTINYKYNKDGIRISKTINNVETKYYLEGSNIILEKTGNDVLYYMYNDVSDLVGFKYNDNIYYYIKNIQNDIIGILDSNYNVIVKYTYDSWGNILSIIDNNGNDISDNNTHIANINPFRYRSYYYDKETKLYYLNSRYYDPLWGRFINADGILVNNNSLLGYNLYLYALNNFINFIDSHGNISIRNWVKQKTKKLSTVVQKCFNYVARIFVNGCSEIAGSLGLKDSSTALINSLQDKPKDLKYGNSSDIASKIKNNEIFKSEMKKVALQNPNGYLESSGSINFGYNDMDLGLAIHKADYEVSGVLTNGKGMLSVTLRDNYNFENWSFSEHSVRKYPIVVINNIANFLEGSGAINNYDIVIQLDYCVNCD